MVNQIFSLFTDSFGNVVVWFADIFGSSGMLVVFEPVILIVLVVRFLVLPIVGRGFGRGSDRASDRREKK